MSELTIERTGDLYNRPDGVYAEYGTPGGTVLVPVSTGFPSIDRQLGITSQAAEVTVEQMPPFELDSEIRDGIIAHAVKEGAVSPESAPMYFQNMQIFLRAVAEHHGEGIILTPSKGVDEMWHRFMERPIAYFGACAEARCFIDHIPNTSDDAIPEGALSLSETFDFLQAYGYDPDPEAWPLDAAGECGGRPCVNGDCTTGGPPREWLAALEVFLRSTGSATLGRQ